VITRGVVLPKGTPQETVDALEAHIEKVMQREDVIKLMKNAGADPVFYGQEKYSAYLDKLNATIAKLVGKLEG
jgi:tripartite-type tricarboxylate transporter receptor subunit TctC